MLSVSIIPLYLFGIANNAENIVVPIFNVDKRPFALLCAYNATDEQKRFVRTLHC